MPTRTEELSCRATKVKELEVWHLRRRSAVAQRGDMKIILPLQPVATSAQGDVPMADVPTVIESFWLEKSYNITQPNSQSNTTMTIRPCSKVSCVHLTTTATTPTALPTWTLSGLLLLFYTHQVHVRWVYKPRVYKRKYSPVIHGLSCIKARLKEHNLNFWITC